MVTSVCAGQGAFGVHLGRFRRCCRKFLFLPCAIMCTEIYPSLLCCQTCRRLHSYKGMASLNHDLFALRYLTHAFSCVLFVGHEYFQCQVSFIPCFSSLCVFIIFYPIYSCLAHVGILEKELLKSTQLQSCFCDRNV